MNSKTKNVKAKSNLFVYVLLASSTKKIGKSISQALKEMRFEKQKKG
jgi:negative regulator of replication initiation